MSLIGQNIGNYRIAAKLGEGGMGAVYLGEHPLIGKRVAIKVLLDELAARQDIVQRFFNEAKAVNDIGHQNIVDVLDFGRTRVDGSGAETVYLVMELLDGESLAARIRRQPLSIAETLHIMEQCCSALHASHGKGVVHRDLKPENIFLCPRGADPLFVKVLDFGIAKLTGDGPASQKTRTGAVIGTPAYMSPEQCRGTGMIDARSDVYSLGVMMYELLTGRLPFRGQGFGEILVAQMTETPAPPSTLNGSIRPEIEAIVLRAMEKDREARFQSMAEMALALRNPAQHATMSFASTPTVAVAQRPPVSTTLSGSSGEVGRATRAGGGGGGRLVIGLGLAGLLVGGGVTAVLLSRSPAPAPTPPLVIAPPESAPPRDEFVSIKITSAPPGAEIVRADGAEAQRTPATLRVKRGAPSFDVALRLAGYKTSTLTVETDRDGALEATLAALPAAAAPPPAASTPAPTATKPHRSSKPRPSPQGSDKPKPPDDDLGLRTPAFMRD